MATQENLWNSLYQATASTVPVSASKTYTHLDAYTLYKAKGNGATKGGFYSDPNGEQWLIKNGHHLAHESVIKEYIAGGLFQQFLGDCAPQTEIIIDTQSKKLMLGSKLLDNFSTFSDFMSQGVFYGNTFPNTFNNKPVTGFAKAISTILFLGDTDAHCENTGLIKVDDHFEFAKIDHGFVFNFHSVWGEGLESLDNVRKHCDKYYHFKDLSKIGFEPLLNAMQSLASFDFSEITQVVEERAAKAQKAMDEVNLKYVDLNFFQQNDGMQGKTLAAYKAEILKGLAENQANLQKLVDFMQLEKAIQDHQIDKLVSLHEKGVTLDTLFKPFFDDGIKHHPVNGQYTKSVNGLSLIQSNWSEIYQPLADNYAAIKSKAIHIKDVLNVETALDGLLHPKLQMAHEGLTGIMQEVVLSAMHHNAPMMMHQDPLIQMHHADCI